MTEKEAGESQDTPSIPGRLPIDILHVSDLHFRGTKSDLKGQRDCWESFLEHISKCVQEGQFKPEIIAFTGDLVHSPGPTAKAAFRRGVNALLELAACCKFVPQVPEWKQDQKSPPAEWWQLLNHRLFIVAGNHDLYPLGLRVLWFRWLKHWLRVACPPGETEPSRAAIAGPLAIQMIDSNGKRAFWRLATGEVVDQIKLNWPLEVGDRFPIALLHGHPVQLPFFLTDLDREAFMVLENAGLLLKNLANLGVRLVLHGHRHYPGICGLSFPNSEGDARPMVVVGAGSVTQLPAVWNHYSYNWIRVYPDRQVEVTRAKLEQHGNQWKLERFVAGRGDFSYDSVLKAVRVMETGDIDVTVRICGFRVAPGRPPVGEIPFGLALALPSTLAAFEFRVLRGGPKPVELRWSNDRSFVTITPSHQADFSPMDLELRYYVHNAVALNDWEAAEMYDHCHTDPFEFTYHRTFCETGKISFEVELPPEFAAHDAIRDFWPQVTQLWGNDDVRAERERGRPAWEPTTRRVSLGWEYPATTLKYSLNWRLCRSGKFGLGKDKKRALAQELALMRSWKRKVFVEHHGGRRSKSLDDLCRSIASSLLADSDITLFLGEVEELRRSHGEEHSPGPGMLCLVGSNLDDVGELAQRNLPFGKGVVGRAFRTGKLILYNVHEAEETQRAYREGKATRPENYYYRQQGDLDYQALLAAPVFPRKIGERFKVDLCSAPFTLAVLCIGTRSQMSALMHMGRADVDTLVKDVVLDVEREIYKLARVS
jgi:hypothetical protein